MKREELESIASLGLLLLMLGIAAFAVFHQTSLKYTSTINFVPNAKPVIPAPPDPITLSEQPVSVDPNLAILSAEWCGPCKRVEHEVLPSLLSSSSLNVVLVDVDKHPDLADKLFNPRTRALPQFVAVHAAGTEIEPLDWLIGYHDAQDVETFAHASHVKCPAAPAVLPSPTIALPQSQIQHRGRAGGFFFHR